LLRSDITKESVVRPGTIEHHTPVKRKRQALELEKKAKKTKTKTKK
jgi:hypothetical protein